MGIGTLTILKNQLLKSGLQQKDQPLFQVINLLIGELGNLSNTVSGSGSSGGGGSVTNVTQITQILSQGDGDSGGGDSSPIPGAQGIQGPAGITGAQGPPFPAFIVLDPDEGEDVLPIPGPQGIIGATGNTGPIGPPFPAFINLDIDYPDDPLPIPGVAGVSGGSWSLIDTRVCSASANEDFPNLSSYSEIFVIALGVTKAVSGTLNLRVSTDNGSTFLSASGDYASIATTGIPTNTASIVLHATNATNARTCEVTIKNFNGSTPHYAIYTVGESSIPTTTVLNAIRIFGSAGGNLTGGTIYVFGRQ